MPAFIERPSIIQAAGTKPKRIEEYAGRVNSGHSQFSAARMEFITFATHFASIVAGRSPAVVTRAGRRFESTSRIETGSAKSGEPAA